MAAKKTTIWTISGMVAAAMDHKDGMHVVQIGRGKDKSSLVCDAKFAVDAVIVHFTVKEGDVTSNITPQEAEGLLRHQKALTPKASVLKKQAKKEAKQAVKAANKAAKKLNDAAAAKKDAKPEAKSEKGKAKKPEQTPALV